MINNIILILPKWVWVSGDSNALTTYIGLGYECNGTQNMMYLGFEFRYVLGTAGEMNQTMTLYFVTFVSISKYIDVKDTVPIQRGNSVFEIMLCTQRS